MPDAVGPAISPLHSRAPSSSSRQARSRDPNPALLHLMASLGQPMSIPARRVEHGHDQVDGWHRAAGPAGAAARRQRRRPGVTRCRPRPSEPAVVLPSPPMAHLHNSSALSTRRSSTLDTSRVLPCAPTQRSGATEVSGRGGGRGGREGRPPAACRATTGDRSECAAGPVSRNLAFSGQSGRTKAPGAVPNGPESVDQSPALTGPSPRRPLPIRHQIAHELHS